MVYYGTIAGALEGTILGIPSFALSQEFSIETRHAPLRLDRTDEAYSDALTTTLK